MEREKLILDVELQDQTAPCEWKINGNPIEPNERIEIKNIGGGKHQLIFNNLELSDEGEITCESGKLSSTCKLAVRVGESRPNIDCPAEFAGSISAPVVLEVPYKGERFPWFVALYFRNFLVTIKEWLKYLRNSQFCKKCNITIIE